MRRPKAGVNRWKLGTDIDFFSAEMEDQMTFHPFALLIVRMMGGDNGDSAVNWQPYLRIRVMVST